MAEHPTQPLVIDPHGVRRFQANAIVRFLLDAGPHDMNRLAVLNFSDADRVQFAQLIGYSLSGFGELSYVSDAAYARAENHISEDVAGELLAQLETAVTWIEDLTDWNITDPSAPGRQEILPQLRAAIANAQKETV